MKPTRIRLMTDHITGIALWDEDATENLEDQLPISDELRQRVKSWLRVGALGGAPAGLARAR